MKFKDIKNLDVIALVENASELFKLSKYKSKKFVEQYIGLGFARSGFYGLLESDTVVKSISRNLVSFNSDQDVNLLIEGVVVLNNTPTNSGTGTIVYSGYGILEINNVVVYDGRNPHISGAVDSIYGRSGIVTAQVSDYDASQVDNDSTVAGAQVSDALNTLKTAGDLNTAKQTNVPTNLAIGAVGATTVQVTSSDGTNATVPGATPSLAGVISAADKTKLDGIQAGATPDQTDSEIETAYNNQVAAVTQAEAEAGTVTTVKRWTPERVKQAITALGGTPSLNNGQVFVGNASNSATSVAMSGDVAINNAGATTIQPDSVSYDKMQDLSQAALLGNQTGPGSVEEIPIIEQFIPTGSIRTLLETTSNWDVNGIYTGSTITGTYQGQSHYNQNYFFMAVDDNVWIRLIRG